VPAAAQHARIAALEKAACGAGGAGTAAAAVPSGNLDEPTSAAILEALGACQRLLSELSARQSTERAPAVPETRGSITVASLGALMTGSTADAPVEQPQVEKLQAQLRQQEQKIRDLQVQREKTWLLRTWADCISQITPLPNSLSHPSRPSPAFLPHYLRLPLLLLPNSCPLTASFFPFDSLCTSLRPSSTRCAPPPTAKSPKPTRSAHRVSLRRSTRRRSKTPVLRAHS